MFFQIFLSIYLLFFLCVENAGVEPTKYPTSELIRRKGAGEPLEDDEDKDALPRGKGNWLGIPSNQLVAENRPGKVSMTGTVQTSKTTLGHSATVKARDTAYEVNAFLSLSAFPFNLWG